MKTLSVKEIEYAAYQLAKELMTFNEPMPDFKTRFPNVLESCLAIPFQSFSGHSPYTGLVEKASILFYLMIKNHPFQNGNKRIAVTALLIFLYKNGKWITVDAMELYNFAKWVAYSNPKVKQPTLAAINQFLQMYLVPLGGVEKSL